MLPLQQLDDGGLSGRNQDDAAILSPTHQSTLRGDVDAGCDLREENTTRKLLMTHSHTAAIVVLNVFKYKCMTAFLNAVVRLGTPLKSEVL